MTDNQLLINVINCMEQHNCL